MKSLIVIAIMFPILALAQVTSNTDGAMDWVYILEFLKGLTPWALNVLTALGTVAVLGTGIDAMVDDKVDKGFMKKLMAIPMLGSLMEALKKFSPFNYRGK